MIGQMTDAASANRLQPHKLSVEKLLFLELKNKTLVTAVLNPPLTRKRESSLLTTYWPESTQSSK